MQDTILIVDFGSQYTQLIARRIRELNIYCEIHPYTKIPAVGDNVKGVVLSGSPSAACGEKAPQADLSDVIGKIPVLGIGYGAYLLALGGGGKVESVSKRDYGRAALDITDAGDPLFKGVSSPAKVWMSYGDKITVLPAGYAAIAGIQDCDDAHKTPNAAFRKTGEQVWGVVFHPEVNQTEEGLQVLKNFCTDICKCDQGWSPESFVEHSVKDLKEMLGNDKVVLGLSGGVDSSVAAVLLHKAIGANLYCIFVDTGLLRKNEFRDVLESYKNMGLNVKGVDASAKFLGDLAGVTDPEAKRKIIGRDFIEVFNAEAKAIQGVRWLGQGTIYPDIVESVSVDGSVAVKSHHNVGGLPKEMALDIVEPLRLLFKDEVRRVGRVLGIDPMILDRHPFPGPGLGVRVLGEVTPEGVRILQDADKIYIDALREHGLYSKVWQAGAILLPIKSVGVQGDARTYESCVALRAVMSTDGMTADWIHLPYEFLMKVSNDIINKVQGVNRVVYDISSKPPATIEWE